MTSLTTLSKKVRRYRFGIGILIILLYFLPYFILRDNSYITIHDNLDSEVASCTILSHNNEVFKSHALIEQVMDGIPRACFPRGLNVALWFYLIFKPFAAYLINDVIVHLLSFTGMYLLLKKHFFPDEKRALVVWGASLCFALLPFYPEYGLTIAGQPLLLYAFLNITNEDYSIGNFLIILLFPFYSMLTLGGPAIFLGLTILFLYDVYRRRRVNKVFVLSVIALGVTYAIVEHGLIRSMLMQSNYVSHRVEFSATRSTVAFAGAVHRGLSNFLFGQYHAVSLHTFILAALCASLAIVLSKKSFKSTDIKILLLFIGIAASLSMFYGLYKWVGLVPLKERFPILKMYQFDRVHWLHPLLWYVIFAFALSFIIEVNHGRLIVSLLILFQIMYMMAAPNNEKRGVLTNEVRNNVRILVSDLEGKQSKVISYRRFFSPKLFREIADFINLPQKSYRVVSIGIHPSIAQYNGFYTLDSYQNNYPLAYKLKFRRIIANELNKSKRWKWYFDEWGSRCYVFVSELDKRGFLLTKDSGLKIHNLSLNTAALRALGGKYVFSAVEIMNAKEDGLIFLEKFERNDSPWEIFLYKVS